MHIQCRIEYTHMQFLAARSLWTNFLSAKYAIPSAMSKHILTSISRDKPCIRPLVIQHSWLATLECTHNFCKVDLANYIILNVCCPTTLVVVLWPPILGTDECS